MNGEPLHPLRSYRADKGGMTLDALAKELGTSKASLSRIETGDQKPSPELAKVISKATGIPAKELRPDLAELMEPADEAAQ